MMTTSVTLKQGIAAAEPQPPREGTPVNPMGTSAKIRRKQPTPTAAELYREAAIRQANRTSEPSRKVFRKGAYQKKAPMSPVSTPPAPKQHR
mmetsp:Transcript_2727/g.4279  ORF Transcript_2727/g.4279 Transcript_2727/m.4279 type:complete len:92 (+) Transcript_2727:135-410(+)